jgi:hypothetical protein
MLRRSCGIWELLKCCVERRSQRVFWQIGATVLPSIRTKLLCCEIGSFVWIDLRVRQKNVSRCWSSRCSRCRKKEHSRLRYPSALFHLLRSLKREISSVKRRNFGPTPHFSERVARPFPFRPPLAFSNSFCIGQHIFPSGDRLWPGSSDNGNSEQRRCSCQVLLQEERIQKPNSAIGSGSTNS